LDLLVVFRYFPMLDVIVSKVFGDPEQEAARMIDGLFLCFAEKNNEAFLGKVGGYVRAVDSPGQMKLQFGLVIQVNGCYVQVQIPLLRCC